VGPIGKRRFSLTDQMRSLELRWSPPNASRVLMAKRELLVSSAVVLSSFPLVIYHPLIFALP